MKNNTKLARVLVCGALMATSTLLTGCGLADIPGLNTITGGAGGAAQAGGGAAGGGALGGLGGLLGGVMNFLPGALKGVANGQPLVQTDLSTFFKIGGALGLGQQGGGASTGGAVGGESIATGIGGGTATPGNFGQSTVEGWTGGLDSSFKPQGSAPTEGFPDPTPASTFGSDGIVSTDTETV